MARKKSRRYRGSGPCARKTCAGKLPPRRGNGRFKKRGR